MNTQGDHREKMETQLKGREDEIADLKAEAEGKDKVGFINRTATSHVDRSEFRKLDNYILGSSAAIITNIGLIVGLGSAWANKGPIIGGLLTFALADNISDSLGIQLYKESEGFGKKLSTLATVLNFLSRLLVSFSFIAIVLIFSTSRAIIVGIVWALLLLTLVSHLVTRINRENSVKEILKHVLIAVIVIVVSRFVGDLIGHYF